MATFDDDEDLKGDEETSGKSWSDEAESAESDGGENIDSWELESEADLEE